GEEPDPASLHAALPIYSGALVQPGQHFALRTYDHALSVGAAAAGMLPALAGRDDEALVLDGPRPYQRLPVGGSGGGGEGRRNREQLHTFGHQPAKEFREADIVANA